MKEPESTARPSGAAAWGRWSRLKPLLRLVVSTLLLALVLRAVQVDWSRVWQILSSFPPQILLAILPVRLLAVVGAALRLQVVFGAHLPGPPPSLLRLSTALMHAELVNKVIPGAVGGMACVSLEVGNTKRVFFLQLVDKVVYLVVVAATALVSAVLISDELLVLVSAAAITSAAALAAGIQLVATRFRSFADDWKLALGTLRALGLMAWSRYLLGAIGGLLTLVILFMMLVSGAGQRIPTAHAWACTTLTTLATAVPLTVNGVGLREWVHLRVLGPIAFPAATLAAVLLLLYLLGFVMALLGYVLLVADRRAPRRSDAQR